MNDLLLRCRFGRAVKVDGIIVNFVCIESIKVRFCYSKIARKRNLVGGIPDVVEGYLRQSPSRIFGINRSRGVQ
jgi:hypothetical protein